MSYYRSSDGYLLQKIVPITALVREIHPEHLCITDEYIKEQQKLKYGPLDDKGRFTDNREEPDYRDESALDKFYVTEMCMPYNPLPESDRDRFFFYEDFGPLCGSSGYIRLRDGYVFSRVIYGMS